MRIVRAVMVTGTVIAGVLLMLSLFALVTSNSRWDDHLINAIGVFAGAVLVSVTLRLVIDVFRPRPGVSTRRKVINILLFVALVFLVGMAATVLWLLRDMSFL